MTVAIARVTLVLAAAQSLKDKRSVVKRLKDLVRNKFNVSIAEVDAHDNWQRAVLGLTLVGSDRRFTESAIDECCASCATTPTSPRTSTSCRTSAAARSMAPTSRTGRGRGHVAAGGARGERGAGRARRGPGARRDQGPRACAAPASSRSRTSASRAICSTPRLLYGARPSTTRRWERVRVGLNHASGYFRQAISRRLRMKVAPAVTFVVDQVFEQAAHVEQLLREIHPVVAKPETAAVEPEADGEASDAEEPDTGEPDDKE